MKPGGKEGLEGVAVDIVLPSVKDAAELAEVEYTPRYGLPSEMSSSKGSSSLRLIFGIAKNENQDNIGAGWLTPNVQFSSSVDMRARLAEIGVRHPHACFYLPPSHTITMSWSCLQP